MLPGLSPESQRMSNKEARHRERYKSAVLKNQRQEQASSSQASTQALCAYNGCHQEMLLTLSYRMFPCRHKVIATEANSVQSLCTTQNPPCCCSLIESDTVSISHKAWISVTRQPRNTQLLLPYPDGVRKFLERIPRLVQVITVMVGSYEHFTRYFYQCMNADGTVRWIELQGLIDVELHVGCFVLLHAQNLEFSCSRDGHGTFKYLVNFWMKQI